MDKKYSKPGREEWVRSIVYILIYAAVISGSAFVLLPGYWVVWGLLVLVGAGLLVDWHRGATVYKCPNCDHVYEISFLTDFFAPHGVGKDGPWLLLRCPECKQRSRTGVLKRE